MTRLQELTEMYEGHGGLTKEREVADMVRLQHDRIKTLEAEAARTEPVVAAAREYCEWRRQRGEPAKYLASVVGSLMKAVRAAGKTD